MKIAYLSGAGIPSKFANSVQTVRMCEAFAALGNDVTLYSRHGDEVVPDLVGRFGLQTGFAFRSFRQRGPKGFHTVTFVARVVDEVRRDPPSLIFARDTFLSFAASFLDRPIVFDAHSLLPSGSVADRVFAKLTRRRALRKIVCITAALKRLYLQRYPWLSDGDIVVLPNGANDPTSGPDSGTEKVQKGPGLQVGYVGHLYQGRGVEQILQAAEELPEHTFHLIGGREQDLRKWSAAGLPTNAIAHGYVPHGQLGSYYRALDILVAPYARKVLDAHGNDSAAFASPMKVFEYMATGRPIVSTSIPGVTEVIDDGENGLLVEPGNGEEFIGALRRLVAEPQLRTSLGEAARRRYLERHSWRARAEGVLRIYDSTSN